MYPRTFGVQTYRGTGLSPKHVCDRAHHGPCKAPRVMRRLRGLAAVVVLGLRRLVARGEEVRRELADELTAKAAAGCPRRAVVLLLLRVAAAVAVCKPADDLVREAAEGTATRVVAAAALLAAEQCVHGHALCAGRRRCQRGGSRTIDGGKGSQGRECGLTPRPLSPVGPSLSIPLVPPASFGITGSNDPSGCLTVWVPSGCVISWRWPGTP